MSNFWANWYIVNRNWHAAFTAFFLLIILIWALIAKHHSNSHPLESKKTMTATVLSVQKHGGNDPQYDRYQCKIEFEDKTTTELVIKKPVPSAGDKVSVVVEAYKGGERLYYHDSSALAY